jgi:putative acetyltransferase
VQIRAFEENEASEALKLFQNCVHMIGRGFYSPEQLHAWAPLDIGHETLATRLLNAWTVVAVGEDRIIGFASLTQDGGEDGWVDMLYVHAEHQGQGVARMLYESLENHAREIHISRLKSDVSLAAKAFFETMGFSIDRVYTKTVLGIDFENRIMSKVIFSPQPFEPQRRRARSPHILLKFVDVGKLF